MLTYCFRFSAAAMGLVEPSVFRPEVHKSHCRHYEMIHSTATKSDTQNTTSAQNNKPHTTTTTGYNTTTTSDNKTVSPGNKPNKPTPTNTTPYSKRIHRFNGTEEQYHTTSTPDIKTTTAYNTNIKPWIKPRNTTSRFSCPDVCMETYNPVRAVFKYESRTFSNICFLNMFLCKGNFSRRILT
jgi:hypothetical protein